MKTLNLLFSGILAVGLLACEGPQGPPGFDGLDGLDGLNGVNVTSTVLEIEGTFSPANDYSIFYEFPNTVEVFESDLVLVYILWEQVDDPSGGAPIDVWRLLPQTRLLEQGILQYNYDHTFTDVSIFLESDFDLATLLPGDTDNQVFRIAVVPGEFGVSDKIDISNLDEVLGALNMKEMDVQSFVKD